MEDFFLNTVGTWLLNMLSGNPAVASILILVGTLRLAVKPLMTLLQLYVKLTPYDNDDKWLSDLEMSKGYKLFLYLMDWLLSVKISEKK
jgi:hypothetical protein